MKKLDEIIRGLKCCERDECDLENCPYAGTKAPCFRNLRIDARKMLEKVRKQRKTRLLTAAEFGGIEAGVGWLESWDPPEDEGGEGDFTLARCAWAGGNLVSEHGHSTVEANARIYGGRYGVRVWLGDAAPDPLERALHEWGEADG